MRLFVSIGVAALVLATAAPLFAEVPADYNTTDAPVTPYFLPHDDAESAVLAALASAKRSICVAHYNIRNERMAEALLAAKARGVDVKIVIDGKNSENEWNTLDDWMIDHGLDVVKEVNTRSSGAIMHHKFTVIDGETVLFGSYNWNHTAELTNNETMLVCRSPSLATVYEEEFEELRGERHETTNRYSGDERIRAYFCPEDRISTVIANEIRKAKKKVRVAMFNLTDKEITRAIEDAARRGVKVEVVTEAKMAGNSSSDESIARAGGHVVVGGNRSSAYSAMHHKYAVIDDENVIVGAANWTKTGTRYSNEDVLAIRDKELAAAFNKDFDGLLLRYDPTFEPPASGTPGADTKVHFVVNHPKTVPGDTVYVVGNHPALGSWDPNRAIPLRTSEDVFPSWTGRATLPAGATVEYKYFTRTASGEILWETGENNVLHVPEHGLPTGVDQDYRFASGPGMADVLRRAGSEASGAED